MKKLLSLLLCVVMCLVLVGCSVDNKSSMNDGTNGQNSNVCSHTYSTATCTEAKTCTKCGITMGSPLGHTTNSGTCSRCGETFVVEIWKISFYVDEFNNPTNEAYMRNLDFFIGTFSNSATTNSKVYARILIDAEDVAIKLWEYGSYEVNAYSTTYYNITILDDNGNKHYTKGTMYKNGERIYLEDWTFVSLLQDNEKLKIHIEENSKYGYNATYLFEVKNGNFNDEYYDFYYNYMN